MLTAGIVGLPNAGKSTLFNALTRSHQAPVAAYPFCTIEPNVGVIEVPDDRLERLAPVYGSAKKVPAAIEFFDIAGLVRGASRGEGLGNKFLGHIRDVDAIVEVVRCFEHADVVHVDGALDPARDVATIRMELALADLETVGRRREKIAKLASSGNRDAQAEMAILERLEAALDASQSVRGVELAAAEREAAGVAHLLTAKPVIYVANVAEAEMGGASAAAGRLAAAAREAGTEAVPVCAELEAQLADLSTAEAREYLDGLGVEGSGVRDLIRAVYRILGLITFFTGNEKEVRARAIRRGSTALEAAGHVHTDLERGFIGAEVIAADLLVREASIHQAREDGKLRLEGKQYEVRDGDVIQFRFHV
jgi:GTP-binding protein YchF